VPSLSLPRPRVLTPDVQARIVRGLAEGSYLASACRAAGISTDTWYYWRRLCKNGVAHAQVYAGFYGACARASAVVEASALEVVRSGRPDWRRAAWFLERRFPERWGKRAAIKHKG
jgi:hypothetical protein